MIQPRAKSPIWVRLLKWIAILVILLVAVFIGVGQFVLDGKYDFSRDIMIKASPQDVHKLVGDLREWPKWSPFTKHDKTLKTTIEKPTGVGAHQQWTGDSGNGELTFTASDEEKGTEFDMRFDEKYDAKGSLTYRKEGEDTRVTWRMFGQNDGLVGRWFAVLTKLLMTPMFDEGLADLKKKVEAK